MCNNHKYNWNCDFYKNLKGKKHYNQYKMKNTIRKINMRRKVKVAILPMILISIKVEKSKPKILNPIFFIDVQAFLLLSLTSLITCLRSQILSLVGSLGIEHHIKMLRNQIKTLKENMVGKLSIFNRKI